MRTANPVHPEHVRNIRHCTFGWIDHNFLHRGFLARLSQEELLLYFFLVTVADKNGVSFYDYERICTLLKLPADDYVRARNLLCARGLIAYRDGLFQVLALPAAAPVAPPPPRRSHEFQTLKEILQTLSRET
ncbi:helix-turn-helix domain-containing protein [candidate division KSB1 bacterium]|nr:helix-turn-helix domain-containing protein [candidate division KSB1 bacterium]